MSPAVQAGDRDDAAQQSGLEGPRRQYLAGGSRFGLFDRRFSIAPMMEWTDRHCRYFHRLLTRRALLYTEMITTGAGLHGDRARLLPFDASEHPLAVQLGGSDLDALAACARICAEAGFAAIPPTGGCAAGRVEDG